jgi:hypothetical protein
MTLEDRKKKGTHRGDVSNSPDHDQDEEVLDDLIEEGLCYRG